MTTSKVPPPEQHPKPKPKGKKPTTPKLKTGPSIDPLDVFEVALSADAGSDSSSNSGQMLEIYISQLSRPQLNRVEKLVQRAQKSVLHAGAQKAKCERLLAVTSDRRKSSVKAEATIVERVKRKLHHIAVDPIWSPSSNHITKMQLEDRVMSIRVFIKKFFVEELEQVKVGLTDGRLLPHRKRQSGENYLQQIIEAILTNE